MGDSSLADIDVGRAPEYFDLCGTGRLACDRLMPSHVTSGHRIFGVFHSRAVVATLVVCHSQVTEVTNCAHTNPYADAARFLIKTHVVNDETGLFVVANEKENCLVFND